MKKYFPVFLISVLLTLLMLSGLFSNLNRSFQDTVFQHKKVLDSDIVLVGIDDKALDMIGPYQEWKRDIIARTIDTLNESKDVHPKVICLDVLYAGYREEEYDAMLVEACAKYDNVIAASVAEFGTAFEIDELGEEIINPNAIISYDQPFFELSEVTTIGNINSMMDTDGVLRHHMLKIDLPDGTKVDSMVLAAAKKYMGRDDIKLPITDSRNFWYLDYSGEPGDYSEGISVIDVLTGDVDASYFDDKIVLIGPYATGLQDSYFTSIDKSVPMYGIEYMANAIQAVLDENYKNEISGKEFYFVLFIVIAVLFYLFLNTSVIIAAICFVSVNCMYIFCAYLLYEKGYVVNLLYFPICISICFVIAIAFNCIKYLLEKKAITDTFKKYVAPEIVNEILKEDPENLGLFGKVADIAVLFVDVRGFTTMSESLEPTVVVSILNEYLTLIADCILKNGGTLDKFVGDAAMAVWGAPLKSDDYVMKAVKAATDMVSAANDLSDRLFQKYGVNVSFGVGVHTGEAVVGNMGSPLRMDYTAIGDTVNTAARLEANAPAGTIYISQAVVDALSERIIVENLHDSISLKGKKEGFYVYKLVGIK